MPPARASVPRAAEMARSSVVSVQGQAHGTSADTSAGWRKASVCATMPPNENPTTTQGAKAVCTKVS